MLPPIDVLDLVQKQDGLMRIHRSIRLKDIVQFRGGNDAVQSLVVKIDIEHFLRGMAFCDQFQCPLIKKVRLAGVPHSGQDISAIVLKLNGALEEFLLDGDDVVLAFLDDVSQYFPVHAVLFRQR